jgi:NAD(P)H-flavin reductase
MGCSIETKNGVKRVCKEGPVFSAVEVILWEKKFNF